MKNVYLIRHALPAFIDDKRMCIGITDLPLSNQGKAQASAMADNLPPVSAVFSSPLRRAVQTAQAIGTPVQILPGLRELHFGEWDGLSFDQIRQRYPELYRARGIDPTLPMPGAEDPDLGLLRFMDAMNEAANTAPGDLAVVAHGGIIARFLEQISGIWYKPTYTEVIPLLFDGNVFYTKDAMYHEDKTETFL